MAGPGRGSIRDAINRALRGGPAVAVRAVEGRPPAVTIMGRRASRCNSAGVFPCRYGRRGRVEVAPSPPAAAGRTVRRSTHWPGVGRSAGRRPNVQPCAGLALSRKRRLAGRGRRQKFAVGAWRRKRFSSGTPFSRWRFNDFVDGGRVAARRDANGSMRHLSRLCGGHGQAN